MEEGRLGTLENVHKDLLCVIFGRLDDVSLCRLGCCNWYFYYLTRFAIDERASQRVSGVFNLSDKDLGSIRYREECACWLTRAEVDVNRVRFLSWHDGGWGRGGVFYVVVWHGDLAIRDFEGRGTLRWFVQLLSVDYERYSHGGVFSKESVQLQPCGHVTLKFNLASRTLEMADGHVRNTANFYFPYTRSRVLNIAPDLRLNHIYEKLLGCSH
jgi:hypothetical protein